MDQHMRRMRELYEGRLNALIRAARCDLDDVMSHRPTLGP
jgi:hypothetical protein